MGLNSRFQSPIRIDSEIRRLITDWAIICHIYSFKHEFGPAVKRWGYGKAIFYPIIFETKNLAIFLRCLIFKHENQNFKMLCCAGCLYKLGAFPTGPARPSQQPGLHLHPRHHVAVRRPPRPNHSAGGAPPLELWLYNVKYHDPGRRNSETQLADLYESLQFWLNENCWEMIKKWQTGFDRQEKYFISTSGEKIVKVKLRLFRLRSYTGRGWGDLIMPD